MSRSRKGIFDPSPSLACRRSSLSLASFHHPQRKRPAGFFVHPPELSAVSSHRSSGNIGYPCKGPGSRLLSEEPLMHRLCGRSAITTGPQLIPDSVLRKRTSVHGAPKRGAPLVSVVRVSHNLSTSLSLGLEATPTKSGALHPRADASSLSPRTKSPRTGLGRSYLCKVRNRRRLIDEGRFGCRGKLPTGFRMSLRLRRAKRFIQFMGPYLLLPNYPRKWTFQALPSLYARMAWLDIIC
ncbi:hypothetical protein BC834DRAFT_181718 [Gloeopeniophorella convolvens]|nr:hypothetical protein BC834DRAFT_181718 [Gloeopeniophorella convolvens]